VALKEWAVAQRALDQGQQVVLLRKGGIREPGKEFRVLHPEFLLYPTFEHQRKDLIKSGWQQALARTVGEAPGPDRVTLTHFAQVFRVFEVTDQAAVELLDLYHIWTPDYAQKRLHWKPRKPLAVMAVRVYRLEQPQTLPVLPEYIGCTSWVALAHGVPLGRLTPVLPDSVFLDRVEQVRRALAQAPVPA
jgi:hypothetical protein